MTGNKTSFYRLTARPAGNEVRPGWASGDARDIDRIEIPLFQRDYAQGRDDDRVRRIRSDFLGVLREAVAGDDPDPVGLDFVYGGVEKGVLRPLDGQQRLTTLFLLHWYVSSLAGELDDGDAWTRFSYATRQSARMFCESLVAHRLPDGEPAPAAWIVDQPWYQFLWRHDPTIQSMLVMLDAIHDRFTDIDVATAWRRLTDSDQPAIWFLLLPLSDLGSETTELRPEGLYIKMNSRGKLLTDFENLKARFEKTIEWSVRAEDFALKIDTDWSDLLWDLRGDDDLIDDEFLRWFEFVIEVCEWRAGRTDRGGQFLSDRAEAVFGAAVPAREANLDLLFASLDTWKTNAIAEVFEGLFTVDESGGSKVRFFFRADGSNRSGPDLFEACCRDYGAMRGKTRVFSLGETVMLYAVLIHRIEGTGDFPGRARMLRNLVEASGDQLRLVDMPSIIGDVERLVRSGDLAGVAALNRAQAAEEQRKESFLAECPELQTTLFRLEDHDLMRGQLQAFELDASSFEQRASTFERLMAAWQIWPDLLGALLAVGEYHQPRQGKFRFGSDSTKGPWRDLFIGADRDTVASTRTMLATLLDRVADHPGDLRESLSGIAGRYLEECRQHDQFDWRYYMVAYPEMRGQGSSLYYADPTDDDGSMGYSLCMLRSGRTAMHSYYWDPYLLAIVAQLDNPGVVEADKTFTGYELRRLPLTASAATIRCVPGGFELTRPPVEDDPNAFDDACHQLGIGDELLFAVGQKTVGGKLVDRTDRVQRGAHLINRLTSFNF